MSLEKQTGDNCTRQSH